MKKKKSLEHLSKPFHPTAPHPHSTDLEAAYCDTALGTWVEEGLSQIEDSIPSNIVSQCILKTRYDFTLERHRVLRGYAQHS